MKKSSTTMILRTLAACVAEFHNHDFATRKKMKESYRRKYEELKFRLKVEDIVRTARALAELNAKHGLRTSEAMFLHVTAVAKGYQTDTEGGVPLAHLSDALAREVCIRLTGSGYRPKLRRNAGGDPFEHFVLCIEW